MIKSFKQLLDIVKKQDSKTICVVNAHDEDVLKSASIAYNENMANSILVGDAQKINEISDQNAIDISGCQVIDETDYHKAIKLSVELIKEKKADILMKGKVQTPDLMKAVLNKEDGLRCSSLLSHVGVFESPNYHKLLFVTDGGLNIAPDVEKKAAIVKNTLPLVNAFGIDSPKVAGVCAIENVTPSMPATLDAALLSVMSIRGQLGNCIFEGPLALDNAVSEHAAKTKGIKSQIAGDVDILLVPNIESGNIAVKSLTYLGNAKLGGIVLGAKCPIVLVSRADSYESKLHSMALSVIMK